MAITNLTCSTKPSAFEDALENGQGVLRLMLKHFGPENPETPLPPA